MEVDEDRNAREEDRSKARKRYLGSVRADLTECQGMK